jgi:hypothetical protein
VGRIATASDKKSAAPGFPKSGAEGNSCAEASLTFKARGCPNPLKTELARNKESTRMKPYKILPILEPVHLFLDLGTEFPSDDGPALYLIKVRFN